MFLESGEQRQPSGQYGLKPCAFHFCRALSPRCRTENIVGMIGARSWHCRLSESSRSQWHGDELPCGCGWSVLQEWREPRLAKEVARDQQPPVRCLGSLTWCDWLVPWAGKRLYIHWVYRAVRSRLSISRPPWNKSSKFFKSVFICTK